MKQFLQQGRPDKVYRGATALVPQGIAAPHSSKDILPNYRKLLPSAEPATMTPIVQTLDSNLIAGAKTTGRVASGNGRVDLKGSDGRLEVQIQAGSLDLSQAVVVSGKSTVAASGTLSLHITQLHGHFIGQINVLGSYQIEVRDAQQRVVSGVKLLAPVTFIYHYQVGQGQTELAPQTGQTVTSVTTTAGYDDLGRMTSLNDPDRGNHTYSYDADGRVISDVSGTRTLGYSFDLLGRLGCSQSTVPTPDPLGACSANTNPYVKNIYDADPTGISWGSTNYAVGRLTQTYALTYYPAPDGSKGEVKENFQYDSRGRSITARQSETIQDGTLTLPNLPQNQMTTSYNDANQVTTTATTVGGQPGYTFSQAYESTTGVSVGLSNNATGTANLATLSYNAQALVSSVNYLTSSGIGSSLASDAFSYDGDLRPAGSTATWQSGSGSTGTIYSQGIGYDPAGNVLTQTMTQAAVPGQTGSGGTETQNFCYDEQNRLVYGSNSTATPAAGNGTCGSAGYQQRLGGTYTSSYVYTHLGQLWQGPYNGKGAYQYLYCNTSQPHQLTAVYPTNTNCANTSGKTQSYGASYDSWSNMTTRTVTGATGTLTYDPQDLLVRWNGSVNNQAEWYMYDGSGSRVLRRSFDGTNITITVYAFGMEEHQYQYSGSGTTSTNTGTTYYYTLGGKLLGTLSGTSTLSTTFMLSDTLSSVVASISNTASSATVLGNQAYGPYGNQRYVAGSLGTSKGYTGQYNDSLTGLDYYNARYYDPVVGRFLSADTVQGNGQGMDPYAYVAGNPETNTDPTGEMAIEGGPLVADGGAIANDTAGNSDVPGGGNDPSGGNWLTPVIGAIGTGLAAVVGWFSIDTGNPADSTIDWRSWGKVFPNRSVNSVTWSTYRANHPHPTGGGGGGWNPPPTKTWTYPGTGPQTQTGGSGGGGGINPPRKPLAPPPDRDHSSKVNVYRVQGGASQERLMVTPDGNIEIQGNGMLFLNFGDDARALEFLARRGADAYIVQFEVNSEFLDFLRSIAVTEPEAPDNPDAPLRVDKKFPDQYGLRSNLFGWLKEFTIPGSAKILMP